MSIRLKAVQGGNGSGITKESRQGKGSCRTTRQLPCTWSAIGRSSPEGQSWLVRPSPSERTGPTSLLNHETSDHLLSLLDCTHSMLWFEVINKTCNCGQFRQSSMLRAASGQLGMASTGAPPPETRNRPRLNAMASSKGSFESKRPPTGNARVNSLVAMVSGESGRLGR